MRGCLFYGRYSFSFSSLFKIPTISTSWANLNNSSVPFPIVFMAATVLPTQGSKEKFFV